jgi:hypothetical protein
VTPSARAMRPLLALLAAGVMGGTVAGCGGDATSPFTPARDLAGMWVRYLPPAQAALPTINVPLADTLFLARDNSGTWSVTVPGGMGPMPGRLVQDVYIEPRGFLVHLWAIPEACDACRMTDARLAPAPWAIVRKGEDRIELRLYLEGSGLERGARPVLGEDVYHYERRTPITSLPD